MRFILGCLSGALGMLAGWLATGIVAVNMATAGRDLGTVFVAFVEIGPIGGLLGLGIGVWLFRRLGIVRAPVADHPTETARPARTRLSRPFAVAVLTLAGVSAWWGWYELMRAP